MLALAWERQVSIVYLSLNSQGDPSAPTPGSLGSLPAAQGPTWTEAASVSCLHWLEGSILAITLAEGHGSTVLLRDRGGALSGVHGSIQMFVVCIAGCYTVDAHSPASSWLAWLQPDLVMCRCCARSADLISDLILSLLVAALKTRQPVRRATAPAAGSDSSHSETA